MIYSRGAEVSEFKNVDEAVRYIDDVMADVRREQMNGHAAYHGKTLAAAAMMVPYVKDRDHWRYTFAGLLAQGLLINNGGHMSAHGMVEEAVGMSDMLIRKLDLDTK